MRRQFLAFAAAALLGMATMTGGAMAFGGHGGGGGFGGHAGGFGGGHVGGFGGGHAGGFGGHPAFGGIHNGPIAGGGVRSFAATPRANVAPGVAGRNFAYRGRHGFHHFHHWYGGYGGLYAFGGVPYLYGYDYNDYCQWPDYYDNPYCTYYYGW